MKWGKPTTLRMPLHIMDALERLAKYRQTPKSKIINAALSHYFDEAPEFKRGKLIEAVYEWQIDVRGIWEPEEKEK